MYPCSRHTTVILSRNGHVVVCTYTLDIFAVFFGGKTDHIMGVGYQNRMQSHVLTAQAIALVISLTYERYRSPVPNLLNARLMHALVRGKNVIELVVRLNSLPFPPRLCDAQSTVTCLRF